MSEHPGIDLLSRALDQTATLVAAVRPDQMDDPTPCGDWSVRQLVTHLIGSPRNFTTMAQGGEVDWAAEMSLPDDPGAAFRADADELLKVVREEPGTINIQIPEFAVHSWDLATALGRTDDLDPEVAEHALQTMSSMLKPEMRGDAFDAEVTVPDDAPVYDRLAAFAGRDPRS